MWPHNLLLALKFIINNPLFVNESMAHWLNVLIHKCTKMATKRTHGTIIWRPCQDIAYLVNKNESLVKLVLLLLVEKEDGVHMQDLECKLY